MQAAINKAARKLRNIVLGFALACGATVAVADITPITVRNAVSAYAIYGACSVSPAICSKIFGYINVLWYDPLANQGGDDASIAINSAITYANSTIVSSTGAIVFAPFGTYSIQNSVFMKNGAQLQGECLPNPGPASSIQCTRIIPGANLTDMITQTSFADAVYSIGFKDLDVDAENTYTISSHIINLSIENSTFEHVIVAGAAPGATSSKVAGDCVHLDVNSGAHPTWDNLFTRNIFSSCVNGYGFYGAVSDSRFVANYFSGNKNDVYLAENGNQFTANELDNTYLAPSGGYALTLINNAAGCAFNDQISGNFFNQNQAGDILLKTQSSGCTTSTDAPSITGNGFANGYGPGITVSNGVGGGSITGNEFSALNGGAPGGTVNISWGGTNNSGWQIVANSFVLGIAARYANLPSDAQVVDGGSGTTNNKLNTTTVRGGYLYTDFNAGTPTYPNQSAGGAFGFNFATGWSEVDYWNTNGSPTQSFCWFQQTGASSSNRIACLDPSGDFAPLGAVAASIKTIATLPSCVSGLKGYLYFVSDTVANSAPTWHGAVNGGGATTVNSLVSCNGSNWQYE